MPAVSKFVWIIFSSVILILLSITAWILFKPQREDDIAEEATRRFLKGDLVALYNLSSPEEQKALNADREALQNFSNLILAPLVSKLRVKSTGAKDYSAPTAQGGFYVETQMPSGKEVIFGFQVTRRRQGSFVDFSVVIAQVLRLQAHQDPKLTVKGIDERRGMIRILESNNTLNDIAMLKGSYSETTKQVRTWAELADRYRDMIKQVENAKSGSTNK